MIINSISGQNQSFGMLKYDDGGIKRLAQTLPVNEVKKIIRNNFFNNCDIFVSEKDVELLTKDPNFILKVGDKVAASKEFTDIEVFNHGKRGIFKLNREMPEEEINRYGHQNRALSFAQAIAAQIDKDFLNWRKMFTWHNGAAEKTPEKIQQAVDEIIKYDINYYKFG